MGQTLFLCLLSSCLPQHYGPALAYTISSCSALGSNVTPLYPVEVKGLQSTWKRLAIANKLSFRSLFSSSSAHSFADHDFSTGLSCKAGPDGVVTLSATALATEPSSIPNHADLPGGHRGPMNPEQQSKIDQMASERPHPGSVFCTSCVTSTVAAKSRSVSSQDENVQSMSEKLLSATSRATRTVPIIVTSEPDSVETGAPGNQKTGSLLSYGCTSSVTSAVAGAVTAPRCKCSISDSTPSPSTSAPCSQTPDAVLPTITAVSTTASPCSNSGTSATPMETPAPAVSSQELLSESIRSLATSPSKSKTCDTSLSGLTSGVTATMDPDIPPSTHSQKGAETTTPGGHFPQKPSKSSCRFSNTTTTAEHTPTSLSVTRSLADMSSTSCITTSVAVPTPFDATEASPVSKFLPCTTSKVSKSHTSAMQPSKHTTVPPSASLTLAEYQTLALPQAYSELTSLSVPVYGHLPEYGTVFSAKGSHSKATPGPSSGHSSRAVSQAQQPSAPPVYKGKPTIKTPINFHSSPALEGSEITPSITPSRAHQPEDASSFLSDASGETPNEQINQSNHVDEQDTAVDTSERNTATSPTQGFATSTPARLQSNRPSALFVTIIAPDERGQLETSIITVEEISPWATVVPRKEQKHQRQELEGDFSDVVLSREQHAEGVTITSTVRTTVVATALNTLEGSNDSATLHNASHTLPLATGLSSIVTAVSNKLRVEWEWAGILAVQMMLIFMIL